MSSYKVTPLGDSALLISFENRIDEEINKRILHFYDLLNNHRPHYVRDLVPAYSSLAVHYDLNLLPSERPGSAFDLVSEQIKNLISKEGESMQHAGRSIRIPVCYSEKFGYDLQEISSKKDLSIEEVINIHLSKKYRVYMIGFLPGFAYMGEIDERIICPRRSQPRTVIPEGSVGIAGKQTGIYPIASPGGWLIIGRTPVRLFNRADKEAVYFQPGDTVEFFSITEHEFEDYQGRNI
jgi:inhibitor of KinA